MILHSQREISARKPGQTLDGDLIVEVKDAGFLFNVSLVYFYDSLLKLLCFLDLELKDQQVLDTCKIYSAYMWLSTQKDTDGDSQLRTWTTKQWCNQEQLDFPIFQCLLENVVYLKVSDA